VEDERLERLAENLGINLEEMKEAIKSLKGKDYLRVAEAWERHIENMFEFVTLHYELYTYYEAGIDFQIADKALSVDFKKCYVT
jgi:hypothetical protein